VAFLSLENYENKPLGEEWTNSTHLDISSLSFAIYFG
jgi:hypothetical protein